MIYIYVLYIYYILFKFLICNLLCLTEEMLDSAISTWNGAMMVAVYIIYSRIRPMIELMLDFKH